jgi:hypothetical protein
MAGVMGVMQVFTCGPKQTLCLEQLVVVDPLLHCQCVHKYTCQCTIACEQFIFTWQPCGHDEGWHLLLQAASKRHDSPSSQCSSGFLSPWALTSHFLAEITAGGATAFANYIPVQPGGTLTITVGAGGSGAAGHGGFSSVGGTAAEDAILIAEGGLGGTLVGGQGGKCSFAANVVPGSTGCGQGGRWVLPQLLLISGSYPVSLLQFGWCSKHTILSLLHSLLEPTIGSHCSHSPWMHTVSYI